MEKEGLYMEGEMCVFDEQKMMGRADGRMSTQQEEKKKKRKREKRKRIRVSSRYTMDGDWRLEK
jgi:hypothetical protein